jgi:hypothetical protein
MPLIKTTTEYAVSHGFHYHWRVTYRDGETVDQFAADGDGAEHRLDLGRPISRLGWLPVDPRLQAMELPIPQSLTPIIFRRVWNVLGGPNYITYCLGCRNERAQRVWYLTPPFTGVLARWTGPLLNRKRILRAVYFPGSLEESEDPDFVCALQRWITGQMDARVTEVLPEERVLWQAEESSPSYVVADH